MQITPSILKLIQADIAASFAEIGKKHGVAIKFGSGRYTASNATVKLEIATVGETGVANTKETQNFKLYASSYGLLPDDFGKPFKTFNGEYTIAGLKPQSRKFPILGKRADGKMFKFRANDVVRGLGRKPTMPDFAGFSNDLGESGFSD